MMIGPPKRTYQRTGASVAICLILLAIDCASAKAQLLQPQPPPRILNLDDGHGILQGMSEGDAERLNAIRGKPLPSYLLDFANAAYFRTLFQLKRSSDYAKKCYGYGMQPDVLAKNPVIATACGQLLAGNFSMQGDVAHWAKIIVATKRAVVPVVQRLTGRTDVVPGGFEGVPADPFIDTVAPHGVRLATDVNVPRIDADNLQKVTGLDARRSSLVDAYLVMVRINGADRAMVLDTGSSISMLRPSTAHALHIKVNPSPYLRLRGGRTIPVRPTSASVERGDVLLGVADRMQLGTGSKIISLTDVPVAIGGNFDVLGLGVLSRLGSLYITSKSVQINAKQTPAACGQPLEIASNLLGAYIPLLMYTVDGVKQRVAFDSGSTTYLTGTSSAPTTHQVAAAVTQRRVDIAGLYEDRYVPVRVTMGSGSSMHTQDIKVFPSHRAGYRYVLGVKALKDFNVLLDFKDREACLEHRGG
jgi:hypothetical protein